MDNRLAITLDVLQSLMAAVGEEVVDAGSRQEAQAAQLHRALERHRQAARDLLALVDACEVIVRRARTL